jgi:hypothetical protein
VGKARSVRKFENLSAFCESTVQTMGESQQPTTLYASTVCYGDSFTFLYVDEFRSQENLRASTARYGKDFTVCITRDKPQELSTPVLLPFEIGYTNCIRHQYVVNTRVPPEHSHTQTDRRML